MYQSLVFVITYPSHILDAVYWKFSSVQLLSHVWLFATPWTAACQLPCPPPTLGACSNSCPSSRWCHPTNLILCCPLLLLPYRDFQASGSFSASQFFISDGQSIGASALASVLPMNLQDWFPLGLTGWISLQSKGLSRVFSNTTVQKHQLFSAQPSLWSSSHIHTYESWKLSVGNLVRKCNFFLHVRKQKEFWIEMVYWVTKDKTKVWSKIVNWTNRYRSSCHLISKNPLMLIYGKTDTIL